MITDHIDFDDRKDIEQCKIYIEYIQALTHHQHLQTTCAVPHTSHGRRLCHKSASVLAPPRAVLHNWRRRNQCGNSGAPSGHSPILPPPTPHYTAPHYTAPHPPLYCPPPTQSTVRLIKRSHHCEKACPCEVIFLIHKFISASCNDHILLLHTHTIYKTFVQLVKERGIVQEGGK